MPPPIWVITYHAPPGRIRYVDSASSLAGVEHVCKRLRARFPGPALARIAHWHVGREPVLLDRHVIEFN